MLQLLFTVEEINLVAIYKADKAAAIRASVAAALPDMDGDIRAIAESASRKLAALTEPEYSAMSFAPAEEYEGGAYV